MNTDRVAAIERRAEEARNRIERGIAAAGLGDDDPLRIIIGGISEAIAVQAEASAIIVGANQPTALSPAKQDELIGRVSRDVWHGARDTLRDSIGWIRPASIAAVAGVALLAAGSGFAAAWWMIDTRVRWMEGSSFAAQIATLNDASVLREYCFTHARMQSADAVACDLPPVWVLRQQPAAEQARREAARSTVMRGLFPEYADDCETAAICYLLEREADGGRVSPADARRVFETVVYGQPDAQIEAVADGQR
jgi:hypothetical protein